MYFCKLNVKSENFNFNKTLLMLNLTDKKSRRELF